jgi:hypothetical protein
MSIPTVKPLEEDCSTVACNSVLERNAVETRTELTLATDWGTNPVPSMSMTNPVRSELNNEAEDTSGIGLTMLNVADVLTLGMRALAQLIVTASVAFGAV